MWELFVVTNLFAFLITTGLFICTMSDGYLTGQIASMVAAQQAGDSDLLVTDTEISMIASSVHGTCICGFALAAIVTEKYGRRRAVSMLSIPVIVNWIITYFAHHAAIFIASRVIVGVFFGGVLSLSVLSTAEYTRPKVRGTCIQIVMTVGFNVGATLAHVAGILFHWRIVALLGVIPAGLSVIIPLFWVESPTWLVSKGRFDDCKKAFRKIHGTSVDTENELKILTEVEKIKQERIALKLQTSSAILPQLTMALKQRYFWRIAVLAVVLHMYRVALGGIMMQTFALTILQGITGSKSVLMSILLVDGFLLIGSILSCFLRRLMKTRTLLFTNGPIAVVTLVALASYLYFKGDEGSVWLSTGLLALYFIVIYSGPAPILESLFGEIYPLELKTYCLFGFGTFGGLLLFASLIISLPLFKLIGFYGVLFLNSLLSALCLCLFWLYLPETKGRTLQEIELYFKNNTFDNLHDLLEGKQIKVLV